MHVLSADLPTSNLKNLDPNHSGSTSELCTHHRTDLLLTAQATVAWRVGERGRTLATQTFLSQLRAGCSRKPAPLAETLHNVRHPTFRIIPPSTLCCGYVPLYSSLCFDNSKSCLNPEFCTSQSTCVQFHDSAYTERTQVQHHSKHLSWRWLASLKGHQPSSRRSVSPRPPISIAESSSTCGETHITIQTR